MINQAMKLLFFFFTEEILLEEGFPKAFPLRFESISALYLSFVHIKNTNIFKPR